MIKFESVKNCEELNTYIKKADESLASLGFTEHSFAHVSKVAIQAEYILKTLGYSQRDCELAKIAGYMHDIGNVINRIDHAQSGAVMAFRTLDRLGFCAEDIADVISAIGNHDEATAFPVNPIAAALILADKCDVRFSRVRNEDFATFDIHDRVNFSVKQAILKVSDDKKEIILRLKVDTSFCSVMDYFEIFIGRMLLCKKAAEKLSLRFRLIINEQMLL